MDFLLFSLKLCHCDLTNFNIYGQTRNLRKPTGSQNYEFDALLDIENVRDMFTVNRDNMDTARYFT